MILGLTIGALAGGELLKIGRRRLQFLNCIIGIIGTATTMYFSLWSIILGRFLYGICAGLLATSLPRYVEEVIPSHIYELGATIFYVSSTVGTLAGYALGAILPADNDIPALKADERWRVLYFYFPGTMLILVILLFLFVIRYDSVKFLITKNDIP